MAHLRATGAERTTDVERLHGVVAGSLVTVVSKLKTRFVDGRRVKNRGLSDLNILVCKNSVVAALGQSEAVYTGVVSAVTVVVITKDERVVGIDGVVETRAEEQVTPRHQEPLAEIDDVEIVIQNGCSHQ